MLKDKYNEIELGKTPFREFFLRHICNPGRLGYGIKCLTSAIVIYAIGITSTALGGTLLEYLNDYGFLVANLVMGVALWSLSRSMREIDDAIILVAPDKKDSAQLRDFFKWAKVQDSVWWYHLDTIGGALIALSVGILVVLPTLIPPQHWVRNGNLITALFYLSWITYLGYVIGVAVNRIFGAVWIIRKYCRDFLNAENIFPLNPDRLGGLRPLGRLALDLELTVAIPSLVILAFLILVPSLAKGTFTIVMSGLYTALLAAVFFVPLSPAHDSMVDAKESALRQLNDLFKRLHTETLPSIELPSPQKLAGMRDLYFLYSEAEKMAVWPLDIRSLIRFSVTSAIPLAGSITINLIFGR